MPEFLLPALFAEHLANFPPEVIYHYTNQIGLLGIIQNRELWATKIRYMNDANEFRIGFDMIKDRLGGDIGSDGVLLAIGQPSLSSLNLEQRRAYLLWRAVDKVTNVNVCIASFCSNGDLLSQWRAYSAGYGFSIGFNAENLKKSGSGQGFRLGACIYDQALQRQIIDQLCDLFIQSDSLSDEQLESVFLNSAILCAAYFKEPSFIEEGEWRLVSSPIDMHELNFRSGKSMIIPYCKFKLRTRSHITPIAHVYVGPCPHMDLALSSVQALLMREQIGVTTLPVGVPGLMPQVLSSKIPYRDW